MSTIERQPTETDKIIWAETRKAKCCFVCKNEFAIGDEVFIIKSNSYMARHTTCARSVPTQPVAPTTEEEHLEKARRMRKIKGSDKRQRAGGHGYTGGDGFKDL